MSKYLSVRESAEYAHKSISTIRRLIEVLKEEKSPHLRTKRLRTTKIGNEKYAQVHSISKHYLDKHFSLQGEDREEEEVSQQEAKQTTLDEQIQEAKTPNASSEVVEILKEQVNDLKESLKEKEKELKEERAKYENVMNRYVALVDDVRRKLLPDMAESEKQEKGENKEAETTENPTEGVVLEKEEDLRKLKITEKKRTRKKRAKEIPHREEEKKNIFRRLFG